ncbi:MAG: hypothetical protein ACRC6T_05395 [Sarcina sp.]
MSFADEIEKSIKQLNSKPVDSLKTNTSKDLFGSGKVTTFELSKGRPVNEGANEHNGNSIILNEVVLDNNKDDN